MTAVLQAVEGAAVATGFLGAVHHCVGALHQGFKRVGRLCHAASYGHRDPEQARRRGQAARFHQSAHALRDGAEADFIDAGNQRQKLIATPAADLVHATHGAGEGLGDHDENPVANFVTMGVVDLLEGIKVHKEQAKGNLEVL